jgi:hypothetical protein
VRAARGTDGLCRRHWERRRRTNGSTQLAPVPITAPDLRTPPVVLRQELERMRASGRTFGQAWRVAVNRATRDLPARSAVFWLCTFREQRRVWQVSYSKEPWPANQRPALTTPELEHRDSRRFLGEIVA